MDKDAALRRRIMSTLLRLLVVMAVLIAGGAFLGSYVSGMQGDTDSVLLPILFSTGGLIISIVVSLYVVRGLAGAAE